MVEHNIISRYYASNSISFIYIHCVPLVYSASIMRAACKEAGVYDANLTLSELSVRKICSRQPMYTHTNLMVEVMF